MDGRGLMAAVLSGPDVFSAHNGVLLVAHALAPSGMTIR